MRATLIAILFAAACGSANKPMTPSAPLELHGTIDGKPFVAQSALMTEMNGKAHPWNDPNKNVTVSTIYVFERVVTCKELSHLKERYYMTLAETEHAVQIELAGFWPLKAGALATSKDVDAAVQTGESRTDVQGSVTIVEATPTSGMISVELKNASSNDGAQGDVRFTVCR